MSTIRRMVFNRLEIGLDGIARQKEPRPQKKPRPPTAAQRRFARVIADKLNLSLPTVSTFCAYWLFIHDHADEFYVRIKRRDF